MEEKDIETFILEDDNDMHMLLKPILTDEGLEKVKLFRHSWELIKEINPKVRVFVIDWRLVNEEINGVDVIRICRDKSPGCYVIGISQYTNEDMLIDLIRVKVDWFIKKNNNYLYELIEEIKNGIKIVSKRDELMANALEIYNRIDKKRKKRMDDAGSTY